MSGLRVGRPRADAAARRAAAAVRSVASVHRPGGGDDVFLFSTPRSGSTWLMELVASQPGFKSCNEPLNLRNPLVRRHLGVSTWTELDDDAGLAAIEAYFRAYREGRVKICDPLPGRGWSRWVTRRIVFKILHGGKAHLGWFRQTFGGRIVLLLRHPVPVALSREALPRLEACLDGPGRRHFAAGELRLAEAVRRDGSPLELGVLAWCLENAVPLRRRSSEWLVLTYEELVLEPERLTERIAAALDLPDPARMLARLHRPSGSSRKSDALTRRHLERGDAEARRWLVEKWRARVDDRELAAVERVLVGFGLDALYSAYDVLPREPLRLASTS